MDDLFEQLKKAPAVNKNLKPPPQRKFESPIELDDFEIKTKLKSSSRRESLPTSSSTSITLKKIKPHKSRSLSPPKDSIKPVRVLVERQKLNDMIKKNKEKQKKSAKSASKSMADAYRDLFKIPSNIVKEVKSPSKANKSAKVIKGDKADKTVKLPQKSEKKLKLDKTISLSETEPENSLKSADKLPKTKLDKTNSKDNITDKTSSEKKLALNISSNIGSASPPKKLTPTKAQKKQFASNDIVTLYQNLNHQQRGKSQKQLYKIRRCAVRLQRQNLKKLQKKLLAIHSKNGKISLGKSDKAKGNKRKGSEKNSPSPTKRAKESMKKDSGFFIKLASPTTLKEKSKKLQTKKTDQKNRLNLNHKGTKAGLFLNNYKSSSTTNPTKFTRTQLIKSFGKRFFKSHVKIEKCNHPLMVIFEYNARARKLLQAKRNKSKNLSVSFKEQVEIFGSTDSEDSDSDVEYRPKDSSARRASVLNAETNKNASASLTALPATPARLKKVENGKVVDDIELDPALFLDPSVVGSGGKTSTPYGHSPGRKKTEKKSYSPLKGDATSSPRKEQFKGLDPLKNWPQSGLRRINIDDMDDEDDEDDDCEYIVPIDIPQRRASYSNSTNAPDSSPSFASAVGVLSPCEDDSDAPSPQDGRLDAPTPDNLEFDTGDHNSIADAASEQNNSGAEKVSNEETDKNNKTPNNQEQLVAAIESESLQALEFSKKSEISGVNAPQDIKENETSKSGQGKGAVPMNEENGSITDGASKTDSQSKDNMHNILKGRVHEVVKDGDMKEITSQNDGSTEYEDSNDVGA